MPDTNFTVTPEELLTVRDVHQALSRGPELRFIHGSDFIKNPERILRQIGTIIANIKRLADVSAALSCNGESTTDLYRAPIDRETAIGIASVINTLTHATEEQIIAALQTLNGSMPRSPAKSKRK